MSIKKECKIEYRYLHPDGRIVSVLSRWEPEIAIDGKVVGFVGAITDITERVEFEKQQLQDVREFE